MTGDRADTWEWRCGACGARFGELPETCPECGHDGFRTFRVW